MPESDFIFAMFPAEVDLSAFEFRPKVNETFTCILQLDSEPVEFINKASQPKPVLVQFTSNLFNFLGVNVVLLLPFWMQAANLLETLFPLLRVVKQRNDVSNNRLNEWKPLVRLFDCEELLSLVAHNEFRVWACATVRVGTELTKLPRRQ